MDARGQKVPIRMLPYLKPYKFGYRMALENLFREPCGDLQSKLVDLDLSDNSVKIKFLNAVYGELGGR